MDNKAWKTRRCADLLRTWQIEFADCLQDQELADHVEDIIQWLLDEASLLDYKAKEAVEAKPPATT